MTDGPVVFDHKAVVPGHSFSWVWGISGEGHIVGTVGSVLAKGRLITMPDWAAERSEMPITS